MIKIVIMSTKFKPLLLLLIVFLLIPACSDGETSSPNLVEISSEDDDEEESEDEEFEYIAPVLPVLPDPPLSSSEWNQVNGPFGGTITSIFKSPDGYWVTTTDNSGLSDSNLYLVDNKEFTWELKKL